MGSDVTKRLASLEQEVEYLRQVAAIPYRAIVEDMSELVVRWRPDGIRLFVNDAYCHFFGASRESLVGTSFWPLITDDDREQVRRRIAALSPSQPVSMGRHKATRPDGSMVWMEWVDRAIFDGTEQLVELQSVGRDISASVEFEEQARRVARGDAAARATASIAHDLRNVLQVIQSVAGLLEDVSPDLPELEQLVQAVGAGVGLLGQLDRLGHGLVLQPTRVELSERVQKLERFLAELAQDGVNLVTHCTKASCPILADPTQIDQILLNLVRNAAEAMPNGGTVSIETSVATSQQQAVLRVVDTGQGIHPELLPRIFDPRISTKPNGQGLGLATVKAIVEGHHGKLEVQSSPKGTTFELAFPIVA